LPITDPSAISWQGSAGAAKYDVLRATAAAGPWKTIGQGISDAALPYAPLFSDSSAAPGQSYYYAVVARNASGTSAPSNQVGPVKVVQRSLVDNCLDTSKVARSDGKVEFATGEDRKTREDSHRLKLAPGSSVTYEVDEPIASWFVEAYFVDEASELKVSASKDGQEFEPCTALVQEWSSAKNDYNYLRHAVVHGDGVPQEARYLRFEFPDANNDEAMAQLGRVVIHYGKIAE